MDAVMKDVATMTQTLYKSRGKTTVNIKSQKALAAVNSKTLRPTREEIAAQMKK